MRGWHPSRSGGQYSPTNCYVENWTHGETTARSTTYRDALDRFLYQVVMMSPTKRNDVMHAARQHCEA